MLINNNMELQGCFLKENHEDKVRAIFFAEQTRPYGKVEIAKKKKTNR